jgi:hypothetical protein
VLALLCLAGTVVTASDLLKRAAHHKELLGAKVGYYDKSQHRERRQGVTAVCTLGPGPSCTTHHHCTRSSTQKANPKQAFEAWMAKHGKGYANDLQVGLVGWLGECSWQQEQATSGLTPPSPNSSVSPGL